MLALTLLTLLACDDPEDDTGAAATCTGGEAAPLAACVLAEDGSVPDSVQATGLTVVGSRQAPEGSCLDPEVHEGAASREGLTLAQAWELVLEADDGARWTVVMHSSEAPGLAQVTAGGLVDLAWARVEAVPFDGEWGSQHLELRDAEGLLAWLGRGHGVAALHTPPELSLSRGEELCRDDYECGTRADYAVQIELAGAAAVLGPAETETIGGFEVSTATEWALVEQLCSEQSTGGGGFALVRAARASD